MAASYPGRVGLQQRVLPSYRVEFFDTLARRCEGGLSLFSGEPGPREAILTGAKPKVAKHRPARNRDLLGGSLYFNLQSGIKQWIADWDPQAVILEANPRYLSNRHAVRWMRRQGRPVVGWGLGAPSGNAFWQTYLRQFDAMIAYSSQGREEYQALGMPAERCFVAVNSMMGRPPPYEPRPTSERPQLLFVGRLQERKRVDNLLRACAASGASPRLRIVGDGPVQEHLERLAGELYPHAEFPGPLQGDGLERAFREADLFVLPGTGGLAVQHAMYYGLPVIAARGDGTQRDLVTQENGWVVRPDDIESLTAAITSALADSVRLPDMGRISHQIVAERANIEVMATVFVEALQVPLRA